MSNRSPAELAKLPIGELRSIAASYRLPLRRDMDIAAIAAMIAQHESGHVERLPVVNVEDASRPAPG